jgi:hypothetical protein
MNRQGWSQLSEPFLFRTAGKHPSNYPNWVLGGLLKVDSNEK